MKASTSEFTHIKGELAYQVFWEKTFNCQKSLNSIRNSYWNLELILYDNKGIVAFRYEIPENLKWAISYDGEWQIYDIKIFSADIWLTNVMQIYRDIL
jgi:hypothetical protein